MTDALLLSVRLGRRSVVIAVPPSVCFSLMLTMGSPATQKLMSASAPPFVSCAETLMCFISAFIMAMVSSP